MTIPTVRFYASKTDAEAASGQACPTAGAVTADTTARFVCVQTGSRIARYAMTPVVGAMMSGNISAMAVAGLGAAICKTPPVMLCNPNESGDPTFTPLNYIGKGIQLVSVGNGSGTWVPGNFGYLDSNSTGNGASALRESLSWANPPGDCLEGNGVETKTGANVSVTDALNSRFDIYDSGSCPSPGSCPASINSVKDVVRSVNANGGNRCRMHNQGWGEAASNYYSLATSATVPLQTTTTPAAMGHPRDMCHAVSINGTCSNGRIGDGVWDRDAYFRVNYRRSGTIPYWAGNTGAGTWRGNTGLPANATRYQVYNWEIANRGVTIDGVVVLGANPAGATGNTKVAYGLPVCSPTEGYGTGYVPGGSIPDRRRLSVAVINCAAQSVNGHSVNVQVEKWIEIFLVEPSHNRTSGKTNAGDVYIEVIGETQTGAAATAGQVIRRDVPYLIR